MGAPFFVLLYYYYARFENAKALLYKVFCAFSPQLTKWVFSLSFYKPVGMVPVKSVHDKRNVMVKQFFCLFCKSLFSIIAPP